MANKQRDVKATSFKRVMFGKGLGQELRIGSFVKFLRTKLAEPRPGVIVDFLVQCAFVNTHTVCLQWLQIPGINLNDEEFSPRSTKAYAQIKLFPHNEIVFVPMQDVLPADGDSVPRKVFSIEK
jgi:hypothetical protein